MAAPDAPEAPRTVEERLADLEEALATLLKLWTAQMALSTTSPR